MSFIYIKGTLIKFSGGIFYSDDEDLKVAMTVSAKLFNYTALVKEVSKRGDILEITGHVCDLAGVRNVLLFVLIFQ